MGWLIIIILIGVGLYFYFKNKGNGQSSPNPTRNTYSSPPSLQKDFEWYYAQGDKQVGPVPYVAIRSLISSGVITPDTLVWREGLQDWIPAKNTELFVLRTQQTARPNNTPAVPQRPLTEEEIEERKQALKESYIKKAKIGAIIAGVVAVIILWTIVIKVLIPSSHYKKGMKAYDAGDYVTAVEEFSKAKRYSNAPEMVLNATSAIHYQNGQDALASGDYSIASSEFASAGDYQDAVSLANTTMLQSHYVAGSELFENGDYEGAALEFQAAIGFEDAEERLGEAYYTLATMQYDAGDYLTAAENYSNANGYEDSEDIIIALGNQSMSGGDYATAVQYFNYSSDSRYADYAQGMDYLVNGNFDEAIASFEGAEDLNDASERMNECHYALGVQNLVASNYTVAASHFESAGTYNGSDVLLLVAEAEDANSNSDISTAVENYDLVPADFVIEEFDVQERRSIFTSSVANAFADLCGSYSVESNVIDTRDQGPYGISYYWTSEEIVDDQNLIIDCSYEDGTYTMSGTFKLFVFNEFSTIRDFLGYDYYYQTFEITDLTSVPNSYTVDDGTTTLSFNGNHVTAHYRVVDNYAVSWDYIYDTQTTFVKE